VGISLHELLYPMAQAYDSVSISADVELGGTDQLFNLLTGRELMEKEGMPPQVCLTLPLLEGIDGVLKMSKSYGNYVGLTDKPAEMFGKVMSIPDTLMVKYYRLCTSLSVDEVDALEEELASGALHPNAAKRRLARQIVETYHSARDALDAEAAFDRVFKSHEAPEEMDEFMTVLAEEEVFIPALLKDAGLVASNAEGRRMISGGGVRVDGRQLPPDTLNLAREQVAGAVLQVGKRRFVRVIESR
jgi:tyrosyl-tRNA synthetase